MDRLAGTQPASESTKVLFQLGEPYGMAVDSKKHLYVADQKVGAIFIFNTETRDVELIKNKVHAHFARIIGLAMDDGDRLFVSDPGLRHIWYSMPTIRRQTSSRRACRIPALWPSIRKTGCSMSPTSNSTRSWSTTRTRSNSSARSAPPGTITNSPLLAISPSPAEWRVDSDGNLYVCDTLNNRIEIFDADGKFISTFGKAGDGPGYFARPKGVAIDSDNHIWVADGMQDRVQVFNQERQLLITFGGHGLLPGQFQGIVGITIDKKNRVFTSEIYPGRVQQFRYVTDAEAEQAPKREGRAARKEVCAGTKKDVMPIANPTAQATQIRIRTLSSKKSKSLNHRVVTSCPLWLRDCSYCCISATLASTSILPLRDFTNPRSYRWLISPTFRLRILCRRFRILDNRSVLDSYNLR